MWVLPLAAGLVSLAFALSLARRSARRPRPHEILWAVALGMYAAASFALSLGAAAGWGPAGYKVYWLFGAVLNVPFLAQGELHLLVRNRTVTGALFLVLLFGTAFATVKVIRAPLDAQFLAEDLPSGRDVLGRGSEAYRLARWYSLPAYAVLVLGTLWSASGLVRRRAGRDRFLGVLAIAAGTTVVAAGAAFAATGNLAGFSVTLAVGIAAMYWGFLRASRPAPPPGAAPGPSTDRPQPSAE